MNAGRGLIAGLALARGDDSRRGTRGTARWLVAAVLPALAAGSLACGGGDGDGARRPDRSPGTPKQRANGAVAEVTDADRVRALMQVRASALEAGDVHAYAATSSGRQRTRDRRAARRAARLRVRDVTLAPVIVDDGGNRMTLEVDEAYSLAGVRSSFRSTRRLIAVRARAGWRIRDVRDGRGAPPWEVARFERRATKHFVVLTPPGVPGDTLLADLEAGYERMRTLLPRGELRRRYLVLVAADAAQARALTSRIRGVETLTAIADAAIRESGPARAVSALVAVRLLVVWPRYAALTFDGRRRVVTHELTHVALADATSGRTPSWLVEGVAMYVSDDRRPAPADADLDALAGPEAIARLSGPAQADAYAASSAAAFAIAERYGRRRLFALYDAFNDPALRGPPGRRLANRAVRRVLGTSLAALEDALG